MLKLTKKLLPTKPINNTGLGFKRGGLRNFMKPAKSLGFRFDTKKRKNKTCLADRQAKRFR